MKKIRVISDSQLVFEGSEYRCAIGKAGFARANDKREGDLKTPMGTYALRELWYRADKLDRPITELSTRIITPADGWCDDATDSAYNRHVALPFAVSHEKLWREDDVYDLIVPLGYNDNPPVAGRGSAIFLHVAKADYLGTQGCVALAKHDLLHILANIKADSAMEISAE